MNKNEFLNKVMDPNAITTITICGSKRFRKLKEEYQAYYTLKGNIVHMPVNYASLTQAFGYDYLSEPCNKKIARKIHFKKIEQSDAILVVNGIEDDYYVGSDTMAEIAYANSLGKIIMLTQMAVDEGEDYYFNKDENFPIYMSDDDDNEEE